MRKLALCLFLLVASACTSGSFFNDPRLHYTQPTLMATPCRADEVASTFTEGANTYAVCTPVGCAGASDCPIPTTGNATIECYRPSGVSQCRLRCAGGGITCPDGMTCVATADTSLTACAYLTTVDAGP